MVVGTFKNTYTVLVHCWYVKDVFEGFCQQIFKKKSEGILGKIGQKLYFRLADFGLRVWVNLLKRENFRQKSFSDNVE